MHALEQLASQFTLAELAERAGITLVELLERTIGRNTNDRHAAVTRKGWTAFRKGMEAKPKKSSKPKPKPHRRSAPDPHLDEAVLAVLRSTKDRVHVSTLTTDPKIAALMSKGGGRIAETIARLIEAGHSIVIEGHTRARTYKLMRS